MRDAENERAEPAEPDEVDLAMLQGPVTQRVADARTALEFARPLVARAAYSVATGDPEASVHVSMAKAHASDAAELAGRAALQCHGAIGYSYEYDLHLWMKRAWALAASWGDARWHRARVAAAIL